MEKTFEIVIEDVKTTIVCKFDQEGFLISHYTKSRRIADSVLIKKLKQDLHSAIEKEDYKSATFIQGRINQVREIESQEPTL